MLVVLTWWGSPDSAGQFVLGLSICAPVMSLVMLQLRSVQVTDVRGRFSFSDYLGARIAWTFIGLLGVVVWAALASPDLLTFQVVLLVGLMKSIDSVSDIVRGLFQHHERMDLNAISLIYKGGASLLGFAVALRLTGSVVWATGVAALAWAVSLATYDLIQAARMTGTLGGDSATIAPRFHLDSMKQLTWIALPLGVVMAVISLQTNIPRFVLQASHGSASLGYFGAIVYPMMAGMIVTTALGQSASPRLARFFETDLNAFIRVTIRLTLLSALLGAALIAATLVLGEWFLGIFYGETYAAFQSEFIVLSVAWGIQLVASCWGYGLTAAQRFRIQVALTGISCLATAVAAWILVPAHGVLGASWSVLVTSLSMAVGFCIALVYAIRRRRAGAL